MPLYASWNTRLECSVEVFAKVHLLQWSIAEARPRFHFKLWGELMTSLARFLWWDRKHCLVCQSLTVRSGMQGILWKWLWLFDIYLGRVLLSHLRNTASSEGSGSSITETDGAWSTNIQTHLNWHDTFKYQRCDYLFPLHVSVMLWLFFLVVLSALSAIIYSLELDYREWERISFGVGCNPHTLA